MSKLTLFNSDGPNATVYIYYFHAKALLKTIFAIKPKTLVSKCTHFLFYFLFFNFIHII